MEKVSNLQWKRESFSVFTRYSSNWDTMVNTIKEMRAERVIGAKTAQYGNGATWLKATGGVNEPYDAMNKIVVKW